MLRIIQIEMQLREGRHGHHPYHRAVGDLTAVYLIDFAVLVFPVGCCEFQFVGTVGGEGNPPL